MPRKSALGILIVVAFILLATSQALANDPIVASAENVRWFQETEQALMNSIAKGDKSAWDRVMDPTCVVSTEEGQRMGKVQFLEELAPLPSGLTGRITVKDLSVDEYTGFAVVRFLADEWESVFTQELTTQYRMTDVFRHVGDDWKMVSSHASVVTRDPPAQTVSSTSWPSFVGTYKLRPDGWTLHVELRDGELWGARNGRAPKRFIPLAPNVFVSSGGLGEWIFVTDTDGRVRRIVDFRKFEPLIWEREEAQAAPAR